MVRTRSPETALFQSSGSGGAPGKPADVWALAAIIMHMLSGQPPLQRSSQAERYKALQSRQPPYQPSSWATDATTTGLASPLQGCFSFEPNQRPKLQMVLQVYCYMQHFQVDSRHVDLSPDVENPPFACFKLRHAADI